MNKSNYYHYTSIKTLFSIITNEELWLSNLKNSNDPNEFYLTCDEYNAYVSKPEIIKEIILDPKCTQDPKELKAFLSHYGYDVEIRRSEISIR